MRRRLQPAGLLLALAIVAPLSGCLGGGGADAQPHVLVVRNDLDTAAVIEVNVTRSGVSHLAFSAPLDPGASVSRELGLDMGAYEVHASTDGASLTGTVELQRPGQLVVVALTTNGLAVTTPL